MTPLEVNTAARRRYNAVGDSRYSDSEIYEMMYQASMEMALESHIIEAIFSTTTASGTQEYDFPSRTIAVKRATYDGKKIAPLTFREDDIITVLNQTVGTTGTPTSYAFFDSIFYLRPVPDAAKTLKIWAIVKPDTVSVTSTLDLPTEFHMALVNFVLSEMSAHDKNYDGAAYYRNLWEKDILRAKSHARKRLRGDAFNIVQSVDNIHQIDLGKM